MPSAVAVPIASPPMAGAAPAVPWGILQELAEDQLVGMLAKGAGQDRIRDDVSALRAALRGRATSAIEELLIDRVVSTWLFLQYVTRQQAATHASLGLTRGPGVALVESSDRRADRASRQHLDALRQLATVRRLLSGAPLFQWNQVNVAVMASEAGIDGDGTR